MTITLHPPAAPAARAFALAAAAFVAAAAVVSVVQAVAPITHGWWLVAYLTLVGGVSQLLLGGGSVALARRADVAPPGPAAAGAQFALWNAGTILVAVADLAGAPAGVLAGSIGLLVALALFTAGLRDLRSAAGARVRGWREAYLLLVVALAVSVVIGTALADALPGQ